MELSDLKYIKFTADTEILPFHSTDKDLNDFSIEVAKEGMPEMMSVTYLSVDPIIVFGIAYINLLRKVMQNIAYFKQNIVTIM